MRLNIFSALKVSFELFAYALGSVIIDLYEFIAS